MTQAEGRLPRSKAWAALERKSINGCKGATGAACSSKHSQEQSLTSQMGRPVGVKLALARAQPHLANEQARQR